MQRQFDVERRFTCLKCDGPLLKYKSSGNSFWHCLICADEPSSTKAIMLYQLAWWEKNPWLLVVLIMASLLLLQYGCQNI
jgi:hypothetical protein